MLKRIHDKRNGLKKTEDTKERWGNKIRGEDYICIWRWCPAQKTFFLHNSNLLFCTMLLESPVTFID